MKALTIWQPWASLIILGHKPYEFRGWPVHKSLRGQRIAIHAGARPVKQSEIAGLIECLRGPEAWLTGLTADALPALEALADDPAQLSHSAVLGTAVLGKPIRATEIIHQFGGPVNDSDRSDQANFAWPMLEISAFQPPIPARGAQGFWNWKGSMT